MVNVPKTMKFRVFDVDDKDQCKSIVRIEQKYMDELAISPGEVIMVAGHRSTAAICIPFTDEDYESQIQKEKQITIEYLNAPDKEDPYPPIRISNLVMSNAAPSGGLNRIISVSRFSSQKQGNLVEASLVTLGSIELFDKLMPDYKEHLDFTEVRERIIVKGDRIDIPFSTGLTAGQDKRRMLSCFTSAVIDARPEGHEFWKIGPNTKFEFQNVDPYLLNDSADRLPRELVKVVPIAKTLHVQDTDITIPSLEIYKEFMKLIVYTNQYFKISLPTMSYNESATAGSPYPMMHFSPDNIEIVLEMKDDLGNSYSNILANGGGGSSGPDPFTGEMISDFQFYYSIRPVLDSGAKEIILTISEIHWTKRDSPIRPITPSSSDGVVFMTPGDSIPARLLIAEGPWEFRIPIFQQL